MVLLIFLYIRISKVLSKIEGKNFYWSKHFPIFYTNRWWQIILDY
ncbi:hypothetical protein GLYMA_06G092466v4 [Glycine max]|nr:hypothetical protein GLYMA_06G092466v4 [Glycine max]KAH1124958.1 hypothetical protein GYH30_014552 [Glycine max]